MTQKQLKKLFEKYSGENGQFHVHDEMYDYDETYFIKDNKVYSIQRDGEEYSTCEVKTEADNFYTTGFEINYKLRKAEEYIKFYNAFKQLKGEAVYHQKLS